MSNDIFRYAGFGEEAEYATEAPAIFHADITGASLDTPDDPLLRYEGGLTRARRLIRPGFYAPAGNVVFGPNVDALAFFFKMALGGYKFTGGTPNTHEAWGSESINLPPFTTRIGKDLFEHRFMGCVLNSLQLTADDSFVELTTDIIAKTDTREDLEDEEDLSLPDEVTLAFHELTATVGFESCRIRDLSITINNNADAARGRAIGTRSPCRIPAGAREVDIALTLWFEDLDQKQRFWGGANGPAATGPTEFALAFKLDGGGGKECAISMPRCIIAAAGHQPSGRTDLDENLTVNALRDTATLADNVTAIPTDILVTTKSEIDEIKGPGS